MEKRTHFYVSRKNLLTWLMALCLTCSAVARMAIAGMKGTGGSLELWSQIILPIAASLIYVLIALLDGKERFYKTAIPVWMIAIYFGFAITTYSFQYKRMVVALYWIALLFFAVVYTEITAGRGRQAWLLLPLFACPVAALLYLNRQALLAQRRDVMLWLLPDLLMLLGLMFVIFAIRFRSG